MSTPVEEAWSPEPELRDPPPRRVRPSDYPDLNAPNVKVFTLAGGILLIAGVALLIFGMAAQNTLYLIAGALGLVLGGVALWMPSNKASRSKERAERLVRDGMPIMARIVSASNLTGDSIHGRVVSYMLTLPGGEVIRRDANADERALPKRIPANVTALVDPNNTNDVELYCVLPLRAVARPTAAPAGAAHAAAPTPSAGGQMGKVDMGPAPRQTPQSQTLPGQAPAPPEQTQSQQQKSSPGYQGLPWE